MTSTADFFSWVDPNRESEGQRVKGGSDERERREIFGVSSVPTYVDSLRIMHDLAFR
jgi:hypothetical protein